MRQPLISLLLVALLALGPSPSSAQATTNGDTSRATTAAPLRRGDRPLSYGRIAGAAYVSGMIGMGTGHLIIGHGSEGRVFLVTQGVGLLAGTVGLGMGLGGDESGVGETLFYSAAVVYLGSRAWELLDLFSTSARHNAKVAADGRARAAVRQRQLGIVPMIGYSGPGLAFRVKL